MPVRIYLHHKVVGDFHVFTSPDLKGLHVSAESEARAQRAVIAMVDAIADELGEPTPAVTFVEIAAAA